MSNELIKSVLSSFDAANSVAAENAEVSQLIREIVVDKTRALPNVVVKGTKWAKVLAGIIELSLTDDDTSPGFNVAHKRAAMDFVLTQRRNRVMDSLGLSLLDVPTADEQAVIDSLVAFSPDEHKRFNRVFRRSATEQGLIDAKAVLVTQSRRRVDHELLRALNDSPFAAGANARYAITSAPRTLLTNNQ